jgi:hypothetical protein
MSKNTYRLINPYVEGSMNTLVNAKNSFSAGKHLYNSVSKFFTNHVEDFNIAVQNVASREINHYKITERRSGGDPNSVDYSMAKIPDNAIPDGINEKLLEKIDKMDKQVGGRKHHSDSSDSLSDSSSEEDYYRDNMYIHPITRFTYFNIPYVRNAIKFVGLNVNDYNSLFMPVFSWPLSPVVQIKMDLYKIN